MKVVLKIHWLLPSLIGICCLADPAQAGRLSSWRFDSAQNRLEFNTDESVQPRAQLVANPTRLVIDLPGTTIAQSPLNQTVGQEIRLIRIGQLDAQTTRIVVELAPGYTLDPQQIQFRGTSSTQWTVQLPEPQAISSTTAIAPSAAARPSIPASPAATAASASIDDSVTQVEGVRVTDDGIFVRTRGARPDVEVKRSRRERETIQVIVDNAVLSPQLTEREVAVDRYGVSRLELSQTEGDSKVQITLHVTEDSPDWQASASGAGGIVILPQGGSAAVAQLVSPERERQPEPVRSNTPEARPPSSQRVSSSTTPVAVPATEEAPDDNPVAIVQGIEVNPASNQLLIRSDRPVTYSGRWQSGLYQITLSPARLAPNVSASEVGGANSPVLRVRLRQQDEETVVVSVQPASGVRFGMLNMVNPQLLALEMTRSSAAAVPPSSSSASSLAPRSRSPIPLPNVQNERLVVVLDPGHGGSDPGAVGIGGLQEKQIVLPIAQQVASYLEQQGVQAILTRADDSDVELEPRVQMAEQTNATLFVSIHANAISMERPEVNGTETYYYSSGADMAQVIQDSIVQNTGMNDKGVRQARFYVLRRTSMPAVLIELGFVTGSEDAPRLANEEFRNQMARAIAQGILQYIQQNSTALNR